MDKPLSNVDLDKFISEVEKNGLNMYQLRNLKPNTHIEEVMGDSGHVVFFYDNKGTNIGHWITMLRNRDGQYYFIDSYGDSPDYYNKNIMKMLRNNKKNGVKSLSINKCLLQDGEGSMTCGRYSIIFVSLNKMGMKPDDMVEFLKKGGKEYGSVDKFVVSLFGERV